MHVSEYRSMPQSALGQRTVSRETLLFFHFVLRQGLSFPQLWYLLELPQDSPISGITDAYHSIQVFM